MTLFKFKFSSDFQDKQESDDLISDTERSVIKINGSISAISDGVGVVYIVIENSLLDFSFGKFHGGKNNS